MVGKTGTGKSTLMGNMAIQDLREGQGLALVDPHGDLAEELLGHIPKPRTNQVVYFNPADYDYPISLNILEAKTGMEQQLVCSSLISTFKHLWRDFWGPRLEYVLHNAILALMDSPNQTLLGIYRILIDEGFRKRIVNRVRDPMVKMFWEREFEEYPPHFQKEVISPIQNKIGRLLTSAPLRNILSQPKSTIDLGFMMDKGRVLLANLAKGKIGEDKANLLGSVITTKIYLAALRRQDVPEEERRDFYLYVDEFQSFTTDIFPQILAEARKYHLNLILSHQHLHQLSRKIEHSVFGNAGTIICFRTGSLDAERLEREFGHRFGKQDMVNLGNYHIYLKLLIDGQQAHPFSAITLPALKREGGEAERETVIQVSRQRFAEKREVVEGKIERWLKKPIPAPA